MDTRRTDPPLPADIYRLVVEQTRDYAVFVLDPKGHIATWNLGAQRIKGYAPQDIIGKHFSIFYMPEAVARKWPEHELKVATQEGRFEDEGWRVRKDGSRFWANVIITALRDERGHLLGFSKITRDITDRRLHEEAMRQSEERFRLLIEGVQDYAIYMLDTEGMVTSWNSGAQRIKGYTREEILGKHFSRFYIPEDMEAGKPWEALAAAKRDGHFEIEAWRQRKNGERFWARVVLTPLYDAEGHLRGFAKVTQDLSERRHLQALEQASRNVNEFIAMLAHELRNPLAPIRTAVQVMANPVANEAAREQMRQTIDRQSAQLARIVDDLLDISRVTRGVLELKKRPEDLVEIVRHAVETSSSHIAARRHTLEIEAPPMPVTVEADAHRLNQVISNLLNNAARYTPEGGAITVRVEAEAGHARVRVRDTGRGIEPEMHERIFDMFVQGRSPLERVGGGLGIGLALARRLAELHEGSLTVASEGMGKGSEFTLTLPLPREARLGQRRTRPEAGEPIVPQRVLVVDDNADAAESLRLLLLSLGHEVRMSFEGAQAIELASQFRPDVVLLDIGMPGMNGYDACRALRAQPWARAATLVALSGWGQEEHKARAREAGFDHYLVKPVDPEALRRLLGAG